MTETAPRSAGVTWSMLHGVAWIARPIADGPPVPVRMEIENGYFGLATLHLTRIERTDGRVGASRTAN